MSEDYTRLATEITPREAQLLEEIEEFKHQLAESASRINVADSLKSLYSVDHPPNVMPEELKAAHYINQILKLKKENQALRDHQQWNETEVIDQLFLELSQFTTATTAREMRLTALNAELLAALKDITKENSPGNYRRALEAIAKAGAAK